MHYTTKLTIILAMVIFIGLVSFVLSVWPDMKLRHRPIMSSTFGGSVLMSYYITQSLLIMGSEG